MRKLYPVRTHEEQNLRMGDETCVRQRQENWRGCLYPKKSRMYDQKAVLYRFNDKLITEKRGGGDKLTIGTVSHVAQSPDSDSNAFFLVVETTVHDKPNGWSGKDNFISSSTGRTTNM